ncbi:MAG: cyanophycinase [Planctomycetales bacterium]|nr:cyanophycinase [Planctomycetales bacterium]
MLPKTLPWLATLAVAACLSSLPSPARAQRFDERFEHWPRQLKINGAIVAGGGLSDATLIVDALNSLSVPQAPVVLTDAADDRRYLAPLLAKGAIAGAASRIVPIDWTRLDEQLQEQLADCRTLCLRIAKPLSREQAESARQIAAPLRQFIQAGGVLACDGFASEWASECIECEAAAATDRRLPGLGLMLDCVVKAKNNTAAQSELLSVLAARPRQVGVAIADDTVVILQGRQLHALGRGSAAILLPANERHPPRSQVIQPRRSPRQPPEEYLVDVTQWRREAMDRDLEPFPPAMPETPHVPNGTLVIVGGGGMPRGLMEQIVELAGGKEQARMVYIPCAEQEDVGERQQTVEAWKRMGVRHATFIHTKDRQRANSDPSFYAPLQEATGLWFGGGRQWNFSDSYYGTKTHQLMKDVLRRGGVIGGSSAGASIQARYLARATPIGNLRIMAPGYERGGLGFIGGVAIDQHFTQRRRQRDMTQLMSTYPQLLGIGLDEATAIIVQHSHASVVGRGQAFFYNRRMPVPKTGPDYVALSAGSSYDLSGRRVLVDAVRPLPPLETP